MSVVIRPVKKKDAFQLACLATDEWESKLTAMAPSFADCDGKIVRCYVAEKSGIIIGFIYGFALPNRTLIPEMLYVQPEYRKAGVGTQLLEHLEKESGCISSMIFYNTTLHDYYAKRGYMTGKNLETAMKSLAIEEIK